jgi:N-acetylmuramoyl-L-alanine amidase
VRAFVLAAVCALLAPSAARAGVTLVQRELPVGSRSLAAAEAPARFDLVGLHWRGSGTVRFRTRSVGGRWSAWHVAAPEREDGPDAASAEARRTAGWHLGNPFWAGPSDRIEYRATGRIERLRGEFVSSPVEEIPLRSTAVAGSPPILSRFAWGALEGIRRNHPIYASAIRLAVVHHTAGTNSYSRAESAAIVRGIEVYHVRGNGWNDIGYNFLVDKYGQVFEGRYGGMQRNVVGAHAEGFNTGSVGVALLGTYDSVDPSPAATTSLEHLIAWRLDLAHVDPVSTLTYISGGNPRFPAGVPVFLRAVSGHRDTGFTSCPGNALYRRLNAIGAAAERAGLPKLWSPRVTGAPGKRVRFTARLSQRLPWTVSVSAAGSRVASGAGDSAAVDWTWDARSAPHRRYGYSIAAPGVRGVRGTVGSPVTTSPPPPPTKPPPVVANLSVDSPILTPNGDGDADIATVTYTLGEPGLVTATLNDAFGTTVTTFVSVHQPAGKQLFTLVPVGVAAGDYTLTVSVKGDDGRTATVSTGISIIL